MIYDADVFSEIITFFVLSLTFLKMFLFSFSMPLQSSNQSISASLPMIAVNSEYDVFEPSTVSVEGSISPSVPIGNANLTPLNNKEALSDSSSSSSSSDSSDSDDSNTNVPKVANNGKLEKYVF